MDVVAQLPPYAHLNEEAVQCIAQASSRYQVPELLIHSILLKENGRTGKCTKNDNGTIDCGLGQINSTWLTDFAKKGVNPSYIVHDACTNIHASAYVLKSNFIKKNDWFQAIVSYNIGPNNWTKERYAIGYAYSKDVVSRWWGLQRWVESKNNINNQGSIPQNKSIIEFNANE